MGDKVTGAVPTRFAFIYVVVVAKSKQVYCAVLAKLDAKKKFNYF